MAAPTVRRARIPNIPQVFLRGSFSPVGRGATRGCKLKPQLHHGGHPVLRRNASCLATISRNDNLMFAEPEREKSTSRIDGISAITNAMARAMLGEQNVYSGTVRSVG
jgi:phage terminase large subunit-like protein